MDTKYTIGLLNASEGIEELRVPFYICLLLISKLCFGQRSDFRREPMRWLVGFSRRFVNPVIDAEIWD